MTRRSFLLLAPFDDEPTSRLLLDAARSLEIEARLETPYRPTAGPVDSIALLPRLGLRNFREGLDRLRDLERQGAVPLNRSGAVERAKSKGLLVELAAPRPQCAVVQAGGSLPDGFELPFVAKKISGARGEGVALIRCAADWGAMSSGESRLLVEEFLPPEARREWRVVVVAGTVVASSCREPTAGEFRSNRARGGRERRGEPSAEVLDAALAATRSAGLGFAGIDVIEFPPRGPMVVDVNDSPGLIGISKTLGRNVAVDLLVRWLREESGPALRDRD